MPAWLDDILEGATKYAPLIKTGVAALSTYASYEDQKKKNKLQQQAYNDYMQQVAGAGQEARAAIDVNYTPMTVSGVPTSKADVTDFTAVAARGGLMSIPNKQRKRYYGGTNPNDIPTMDDQIPFDPREEGISIGEQVFYDTGKGDRSNAQMIWGQMQDPDKAIFDFDFEIFFMDGGWRDMIKSQVDVQEDTQMASAPDPTAEMNDFSIQEYGKALHELTPAQLEALYDLANDQAAAPAAEGIMQAAKGGRIGYGKGGSIAKLIDGGMDPSTALSMWDDWKDSGSQLSFEDYVGYGTIDNYAHGGRIGLQSGFTDPKNMTTEMLIAVVKDGRSTPEILIELEKRIPGAIEQIKLEEGQGDQAFSINEHILEQYDPDKRAVEEDFLYDLRENNPDVYGEYHEPMEHLPTAAKGGRIKKAPGGIMNLGGLEKDYRTTGGFVPIGAYEKKDDVPARLSKNEFVMTADAVRAAGGGSINRGAQRMYDTMKHLEASPQARRMTA